MTTDFWENCQLEKFRRKVKPSQVPCVQVEHSRIYKNQKGGFTTVRLWIDRNCFVSGASFCCLKDTYNKRKGKSIAFGRLMRSIYLSGSKPEYLGRIKKLIESEIGIVDKFYFNAAYNGDKIE